MHFEILVEDASGKIVLESLVDKILATCDGSNSCRIISYKGIGRIPNNLRGTTEPRKRILLDRLPRLLAGYGQSLRHVKATVVVVVDLDRRDCGEFKNELLGLHAKCNPAPTALFRIAIEEMEAWLLGDREAVLRAYPDARVAVLDAYDQDSICGTWEVLADTVHPGGASQLKQLGWPAPGQAKCEWARRIAPELDVDNNQSPSFQAFRDGLLRFADKGDASEATT